MTYIHPVEAGATLTKAPDIIIPAGYLTMHSIRQLGFDLYAIRLCNNDPLRECARKLGVNPEEIDELERGTAPYLNLTLALRLVKLYDEGLFIGGGDQYV